MERKRKYTALNAFLERSPLMYTGPLKSGDRAFIIQQNSLDSVMITKLISLGVHTFTAVSVRGLQNIQIEY